MIKAILIDVKKKEVREIELVSRNYTAICCVIGEYCEYLQFITLFQRHILCIDEQGLLHKDKLPGAFMFGNSVYGGRGVILDIDGDDECHPCTMDIEVARRWTKFLPIEMLPEPLLHLTKFK